MCERLLELAKKGSSLQQQFEKVEKSHTNLKTTFSTISQSSTITSGSKSPVKQSISKDSLIGANSKRKKKSLLAVRNRLRSISMEDLENEKFKSVLDEPVSECQSIHSSSSGIVTPGVYDDDDDDNSIVFGNSVTDLKAACSRGSSGIGGKNMNSVQDSNDMNGRRPSPQSDVTSQTGTSNWSIDQSVSTMDMSEECVQNVGYALSADKIEDYVRERTAECKVSG